MLPRITLRSNPLIRIITKDNKLPQSDERPKTKLNESIKKVKTSKVGTDKVNN